MAIEAEELATISRSIRSAGQETAGEFRQAANASNSNLARIVKDISMTFKAQREDIADLHNVLEEMVSESQQTGNKIDSLNSLFRESLEIQTSMRTEMSNVTRNTKILSGDIENLNRNIMNTTAGTGLLGSITNIGQNVADKLLAAGIGAAVGATATNMMSGGGGNTGSTGGAGGELNNYSGSEKDAKAAADKYAGRTLSANEWKELIKATNAEAGQKSQTEAAMVMASIINRSRDKQKSIEQVLREPNQFQAVTGTRVNPGPSAAFTAGPGQKRAEQIYGAAANILEHVSKQQKDFTAASAAAYGAGTNIGYRDKMLKAGGSIVGASVFNTAAPNISKTPNTESITTPSTTPPTANPVSTPEVIPSANDPRVERIGKEGGHGPVSGAAHEGHAEKVESSSSLPSGDIVALGNALKKMGINPSEHPSFGGVNPSKHGPNSAHNDGMAIDINAPGGITEAQDPVWGPKFDKLAQQIQAAGYTVLWRARNHFDHIHAQIGGKGIRGGRSYIGGSPSGGAQPTTEKHGSGETTPQQTNQISAVVTPSSASVPAAVVTPSSASVPAAVAQMAEPVSQAPVSQASMTSSAAPLAMTNMMPGMMGGGIGGIAGILLPMIASTIQSEMVSTPSAPALNTQTVNQTAVTSQATEQTIQEAQGSFFNPQVNVEPNRMTAMNQSGFAYNMPGDIDWPDWAGMLGGNHWEEMKNYKKNMSWG